MYCVVYWARYVRKGEVKRGGIKIGNEGLHRLQSLANQGLETP